MIINSYITEYNSEKLTNLISAFKLSAVLLILGLVITMVLGLKLKNKNAPIIKFSCIFSNAAYMGFPLIQAVFGNDGLLYASAFLTIYNILMWTVGYAMVSRKADFKAVIKTIVTTPVIISVIIGILIFVLRIPVPNVIHQAFSTAGSMNTPLSMFITGMMIAGSTFERIFKNKLLIFTIAVRMFLIPALCLGLFALLGVKGIVADIVLLLEACPCAAITSVFAVQFGYDEDIAAGSVVITTVLSIITLPIFAYLITSVI